MSFHLALMGISLYILIWEKLPEWGTWFNALLAKLPQPLQTLYQQWRCAYCAGFWIALALHAVTGQGYAFLGGDAAFLNLTDAGAICNADLGLDNVNAGDNLGDGMLHLDAGVYLNEIKFVAVHIHEEFSCTGI